MQHVLFFCCQGLIYFEPSFFPSSNNNNNNKKQINEFKGEVGDLTYWANDYSRVKYSSVPVASFHLLD